MRRKQVLVVDDDYDVRSYFETAFETYGFDCRTAQDGAEGLECVRLAMPDVILMDLQMPVLDGLAATRALRANPQTRNVPIIAVSARVTEFDELDLDEACFDDVVSKSIDLTALIRLARKWSRYEPGFF